jgi:hypothetical protein
MSMDGPGGLFDNLDDPTPPAFGSDLLSGIVRRGHHIRQRRRMAYVVGSAGVAVVIAGTAVGLTAAGNGNSGEPITPLSPTPSVSHTKKPNHPKHTPSSPVTGGQGTGTSSGGHKPPTTCVTPTPTAMETLSPTPLWTAGEPDGSESTTSPAPTAVDTTCATPTPTSTDSPMATESPTPTYSIPPLLGDDWQPSAAISFGIW